MDENVLGRTVLIFIMKKIVILDGYAANPGDLSWLPLNELGELTVYDRTLPHQLLQRAAEAEILLTNKVLIHRKHIEQLPQLRYIGLLATGYNTVDIAAAKEKGIVVTNIPAYSTEGVAQIVFAHLLNVTNRVDHYARQNRAGWWSRQQDFCYWNTPLEELSGKNIGIVGLGSIGMRVSQIAQAFGLNVFAYTSKHAKELPDYIRKTTLDGLFAVSDVLTLHCPLTEQTRELMNDETIAKMRTGAILINTGRGPLVNEQAVAKALACGKLSAYCADVLCEEPPSASHPLLQCHHAFITPHIAWATVEARGRLVNIAIENVKAFLAGHPQHVVNA